MQMANSNAQHALVCCLVQQATGEDPITKASRESEKVQLGGREFLLTGEEEQTEAMDEESLGCENGW